MPRRRVSVTNYVDWVPFCEHSTVKEWEDDEFEGRSKSSSYLCWTDDPESKWYPSGPPNCS